MALMRIWLIDSRSLRKEVSCLAVTSIIATGTDPHEIPTNFRVFARSARHRAASAPAASSPLAASRAPPLLLPFGAPREQRDWRGPSVRSLSYCFPPAGETLTAATR